MKHIPYCVQGALFGPVFIGLLFVLKGLCPVSTDAGCFADYLAVPIFLPLVSIYRVFGTSQALVHELWLVLLYWSFVGLLAGFIFDLHTPQSRY